MTEQKRKPAVFLDRDGVLTKEKGYVGEEEKLEIFSYAKASVEQIHQKGYLAIVITNQSGVARGYFSEKELLKMNRRLVRETGVDGVYYCPHHPDGIIPEYRQVCKCRKPGTGMIERACAEFNINRERSYMIGDRVSDIQTGIKAGVKTVLVKSGHPISDTEEQIKPDMTMENLWEFVERELPKIERKEECG